MLAFLCVFVSVFAADVIISYPFFLCGCMECALPVLPICVFASAVVVALCQILCLFLRISPCLV